jgi:hypothetical protein
MSHKAHQLPQLTIRDLFWLVLVVALGLGWWLENPGRRANVMAWLKGTNTDSSYVTVIYSVADVVPLSPGGVADFDALADRVKEHVTQDEWDSAGGYATANAFATNLSLVVRHNEDGQERVAAYLKQLRQAKKVK